MFRKYIETFWPNQKKWNQNLVQLKKKTLKEACLS